MRENTLKKSGKFKKHFEQVKESFFMRNLHTKCLLNHKKCEMIMKTSFSKTNILILVT